MTTKIVPLDVFGFRIRKNFVLMDHDVNLHLRNNIIKLQSLTHNQLSSPRDVNHLKYSWHISGYITARPEKFENPVEFGFGESCTPHCEIPWLYQFCRHSLLLV